MSIALHEKMKSTVGYRYSYVYAVASATQVILHAHLAVCMQLCKCMCTCMCESLGELCRGEATLYHGQLRISPVVVLPTN